MSGFALSGRQPFSLHRLSGVRELRKRVRPYRAESFSLNLSEGIRRAPRRGKRVDTKVSTLLTPTSFWESLAQIADMRPLRKGERQRIFSTVGEHSVLPCRNLYAVPDIVLLHIWVTLRRRGMTVPRNPLARYTAWHLRIRRLVQFILAGAVYHNALTSCATRVCCACLDEITCVAVRYLKLRTGCERHGRKNPLPFPYFEAVAALRFSPGYQARER